MKQKKLKIVYSAFFFLFPFSFFLLSGCLRLTGGAGVWKQSAEEEDPTVHQVGFDTQQIVPRKNNANVTV